MGRKCPDTIGADPVKMTSFPHFEKKCGWYASIPQSVLETKHKPGWLKHAVWFVWNGGNNASLKACYVQGRTYGYVCDGRDVRYSQWVETKLIFGLNTIQSFLHAFEGLVCVRQGKCWLSCHSKFKMFPWEIAITAWVELNNSLFASYCGKYGL